MRKRKNHLEPQSFALGLLCGAGLMFLLDPMGGRRRRALLRDQAVHGMHEVEDLGEAASDQARHLRNRTRGMVAEMRARFRREQVDDSVLEERVRAELGRLVSNPGALNVSADHGRVTLTGHVLAGELEKLLTGIEHVRGVHEVVNRTEAHETAGSIPDLQGS